jgi:hypothetical protein
MVVTGPNLDAWWDEPEYTKRRDDHAAFLEAPGESAGRL